MSETFTCDDRQAGRPLKPPNKKKFEDELDGFNVSIKQKEEELKSLGVQPPEKFESDLRKLRNDREQKFRRRQSIDGDLREISENIRKQELDLTKVQSILQYRSEHKINDAIQRLETQLKTRNFRLSEEKKIVAEIDSLKRSTKDLTTYLGIKKQIDEKREQQRKLRDERDCLQKMVTEIKQKEETLRQDGVIKNEMAECIRHDLGDLEQKAKDLQIAFSTQEREYRQQKEELRRKQQAAIQHRKKEDRRVVEEAQKLEMEAIEASRDPYEEEKVLCNALIKHLQRFLGTDEEIDSKAANDVLSSSHGSKLDLLNQSLRAEGGMYLLRRKSDVEEMQSAKMSRRKNKRRPSMKKPIVHTPEIFEQFSRLQLTAPVTAAEARSSISQLQDKLAHFESSSKDGLELCYGIPSTPGLAEHLSCLNAAPCNCSIASTANSYSESAVSGSVPTTPDIQLDSIGKLLQVSDCQRRLSSDSGTGDTDDATATVQLNVSSEQLQDQAICHDSNLLEWAL